MKISIITIAYNSAKTIRDTLESVSNQSYSNIEHIIIDGGSSDQTLAIIATFPHVSKVISEQDKGIYDAMNKGVFLATGDIIGILNSDDLFADVDILEKIATCFKQNKTISSVYGNLAYFKGNNKNDIVRYWRSKPYYPSYFEDGEVPPHPTLFVRREVYEQIGGYWANFRISGDNEFIFRMFKIYGYKGHFLDTTFVKMRIGGVSTNGLKSYLISTIELMRVWKMNGYKYPKRLFLLRPYKKINQLFGQHEKD